MSAIVMAIDNAENVRNSKLKLYIDVGDQDLGDFHIATELPSGIMEYSIFCLVQTTRVPDAGVMDRSQ